MSRVVLIVYALSCAAEAPDLDKLARELADADFKVRYQAAADVVNNEYREAPPEQLMKVLIDSLKEPAAGPAQDQTPQGLVIEYLSRRFGPKAGAALPHLLRIVRDDKNGAYLRGRAIEASAKIAPRDPGVVAALIAALENPNPTSSSGVHDRAIAALGGMGQAAWPAKKALAKMLKHPWYQDGAYVALGKLALAGEMPTTEASLQRLADVDRQSVDDASAAFLHVVEAGLKDRAVAERARPVLWLTIDKRGNDIVSRAALRTLIEIGPGGRPDWARILVRCMFTRWDPKEADIASLAESALYRFEAKEPEAGAVFADAFAQALKKMGRWPHAASLARNLARFGKLSAPAAPHVIAALRALPEYRPTSYGRDLLEAYTELAAVLGDEPGVRAVVLELLAPDSKLIKSSNEYRWAVQSRLLLTLSRQGLPADGPERTLVLNQIQEGLRSVHCVRFPAAARALQENPRLRPQEVQDLLPHLTRVLAFDFRFNPDAAAQTQSWLGTFQDREPLVEGQRAAMQALAALGPAARDALPTLENWAKRPLEKRVSDYLPEPAVNLAIREAAVAIKAIKAQ